MLFTIDSCMTILCHLFVYTFIVPNKIVFVIDEFKELIAHKNNW